MTWPTSDVTTTALDAGTDAPPRAEFLSWAQKFNQMRAHVSAFMQGLLGSADAAAARTTLDVPSRSGGNATGTWAIAISGNAATATTAANVNRSVTGAGLATGGGALTADQAITVTKASQAQAEAGTDDATAMTPLRTKQAIYALGRVQLGTAVSSTSGVAIDLVGIPATANRIYLSFNGVSTNGTSLLHVRAGTASGVVSAGYVATVVAFQAAGSAVGTSTAGFPLDTSNAATHARYGVFTLSRVSGNEWSIDGSMTDSSAFRHTIVAGHIALPGALDRLRITTAGGTDVFDAGSINIAWE